MPGPSARAPDTPCMRGWGTHVKEECAIWYHMKTIQVNIMRKLKSLLAFLAL